MDLIKFQLLWVHVLLIEFNSDVLEQKLWVVPYVYVLSLQNQSPEERIISGTKEVLGAIVEIRSLLGLWNLPWCFQTTTLRGKAHMKSLDCQPGEMALACLPADLEMPSSARRMDALHSSSLQHRHYYGTHAQHTAAGITLVRLLSARYWEDSCDTLCIKLLLAACPSHSCWAFSFSLLSWGS